MIQMHYIFQQCKFVQQQSYLHVLVCNKQNNNFTVHITQAYVSLAPEYAFE